MQYKAKAIICDIDMTIADCSHRLFYILQGKKDFESFHGACDMDTPISPIVLLVSQLSSLGYRIIFSTGRPERFRQKTVDWISKHIAISGSFDLHMRSDGDKRKDYEIKVEVYEGQIFPKYDVAFALDDRDQVVRAYRGIGLTVLQVADGKY